MSNEVETLWIRFRSMDILRKRALKSRVLDIIYSTMSPMCLPPQKIKNKREVKKGKTPKRYDVYWNS